MIAAKELLLTRNSVKEVAFDLHYRQVSHFCREFKLFHNRTPLEYLAAARPRPSDLSELLSRFDNRCRVSATERDCIAADSAR
jgi:AraC-like DNA-binding protein